ncbi:MAG: hypothetical protein FJY67_08655 [Calditrichaeota bacterium]|nr:hypothetical protein [Calditrichota bacterium]
MPLRQPRRFGYKSRTGSEDDGRIRFRRITSFDPHDTVRYPRVLIVLLAIIVIILILLGGPRRLAGPFDLSPADVAGKP